MKALFNRISGEIKFFVDTLDMREAIRILVGGIVFTSMVLIIAFCVVMILRSI